MGDGLVNSRPTSLTRMDPLSSPDLLFAMPTRSTPLFHVTPNDVKLLMRPNETGENAEHLTAAWEALIALFFAMAQIMRLCTVYERINKSPFASYHQHALVSSDTLTLVLPEQLLVREDERNPPLTVHGLGTINRHKQSCQNGVNHFMPAISRRPQLCHQ